MILNELAPGAEPLADAILNSQSRALPLQNTLIYSRLFEYNSFTKDVHYFPSPALRLRYIIIYLHIFRCPSYYQRKMYHDKEHGLLISPHHAPSFGVYFTQVFSTVIFVSVNGRNRFLARLCSRWQSIGS